MKPKILCLLDYVFPHTKGALDWKNMGPNFWVKLGHPRPVRTKFWKNVVLSKRFRGVFSGRLLLCVETILSVSIARTELGDDAYFSLCTVLHAWFCSVFNYLRYFERTFSLLFMVNCYKGSSPYQGLHRSPRGEKQNMYLLSVGGEGSLWLLRMDGGEWIGGTLQHLCQTGAENIAQT